MESVKKKKRITLRISSDLYETLENLSRFTGLTKSDLIRLSIMELQNKALEEKDLPKWLRKTILKNKAESLIREIKELRRMAHLKKSASDWINYHNRIENGEIKEGLGMDSKFSVLLKMASNLRKELAKKEEELLRITKEYEEIV